MGNRNFLARDSARLGAAQNIATSTTSAASTAFASTTYQIRVVVDVATRVRIGDGTPTAVVADTLLPATGRNISRSGQRKRSRSSSAPAPATCPSQRLRNDADAA